MKPRNSAYKHNVNGIWLTDEGLEQWTVAEWLRFHKVMFLHSPNEGKRDKRLGQMLKMLGLEPGAADIIIFDSPPGPAAFYRGTAIEMKTKTGKATLSQKDWLAELAKRGWYVAICNGSNEAIELLEELAYDRKRK